MTARREFMNYVGTGAIGAIIGFYAGARELLGIQSAGSEIAAPSPTATPTDRETPADGAASVDSETPTDEAASTDSETPTDSELSTEDANADAGVLDGFENPDQLNWAVENGGPSRLEFSTEAAEGEYSLHFLRDEEDVSTSIQRSIDPTQLSSFSLWFRYESSNDNNFRIILESSTGQKALEFREFFGQMHYRDPQKRGQTVSHSGVARVDENRWYRLVVEDIDFSNHTFDASVYDIAGDRVGGVTGVGFWTATEDVGTIRITNGLGNNGNPDPLWIDHVTYQPS